jgi:hypothetical protein
VTGAAAAVAAAQPWRALPAPTVRHLRLVGAHDRKVLPAWHVRNAITPRAHEGAYSHIAAWQSRRHWLDVVVDLVIEHRPDVLARHKISPDTFRHWARVETLFADWRTGRRCIRRPCTVARLAELHERTVQRCRAAARELGIYVDVVKGRMLRLGEILLARFHGSPQRGLANEAAFTIPHWVQRVLDRRSAAEAAFRETFGTTARQALRPVLQLVRGVDAATPTSGATTRTRQLTVDSGSSEPKAKAEPASPAQQPQHVGRRRRSAGYRLALAVRERLPWLAQCPAGRLSGVLEAYASSAWRWTAQDVVEHVDRTNRARGWTTPQPASVEWPYALLAAYFRDHTADPDPNTGRRPQLDPVEHHPRADLFLWRERTERERVARAEHRRRGGCGVPGCPAC